MLLYATTGGMWTYPSRITYSIVPDGTSIGGTPSNLQQTLSSLPSWQQQIEKAAAVWEAVTGINFVQVPDDGAPIGSSGDQQGDPNVGDIRIGGMAQSLGQLAFAFLPPRFNGGTNAGDIFFNTSQSWQTNGTTYDVLTVAIHEFGHALGMSHSAISTADMYASYHGTAQTLTSDDTSGIQSIYGPPPPDGSNRSSTYASDITPDIDGNGQIALANIAIVTSVDVDWYKVTVPASTTGTMVVTMQSSALSSLIPKVTVYNANLQGAVTSVGSNYGDTTRVTISGVSPGQTWYIKAMAGVSGAGSIGAFGLLVNFGSSPQAPIAPPSTVVAAQPDQDPSTSPEGTGWTIGGNFIPYLGILDPLLGGLDGDGIFRIVYGSLSGYGDTMGVGNRATSRHHPARPLGHPRLQTHHRRHPAKAPDHSAEMTIISQVDHAGAGPNRRGVEAMPPPRGGRPGSAGAVRLRAVDATLSGWRSGRLLAGRPPWAGGLSPARGPAPSVSPAPDRDLLQDRQIHT